MDKQKIIKGIKKILDNYTEIMSVYLIGSFLKKKKLGKINDLDLLIIVSTINNKFIDSLKKDFSKFCYTYSNSVKFDYTFKMGPIKPASTKKRVVEISLLLHTIKEVKKLPEIRLYHCKYGKLLTGKNYDKLGIKFRKPLLKEYLSGKRGLNFMINLLKREKYFYKEWLIKNKKPLLTIKQKKCNNHELIDISLYAVISETKNFVFIIKNKIDEKLIKKTNFEKREEIDYFLNLKNKFINNRLRINKKIAEEVNKKALNYLIALKNFAKN